MKNDGGVLGMFIKNRTAHQLCPMVGIFSTGTGALDGQYADTLENLTKCSVSFANEFRIFEGIEDLVLMEQLKYGLSLWRQVT